MRPLVLLVIASLSCSHLAAQFEPQSAHVLLYFPQLADGGDGTQQWQTTFIFTNPNSTWTAQCEVRLLADDGSPLVIDLGSGSVSQFQLSVPPQGRRTLISRMVSRTILSGWAKAACTLPVQATVLFRALENGKPQVEISAPSASPSAVFRSAANGSLGIAIANVYINASLDVTVTAFDNDGRRVQSNSLRLCPSCHRSFNLSDFMSLPSSFEGSILIESSRIMEGFVAWTLNAERGLLSSLPSGGLGWPAPHHDQLWLVFLKTLAAAARLYPQVDYSALRFNIGTEPIINAFARRDGLVQVNLALAQLMGDSPSELAFIVGHEIAHYMQFRLNRPITGFTSNIEIDADLVGMILSLTAGYDPYGGAGALGKLMMATQRTGLVAQYFDDLNDPHTSFANRMGTMFERLSTACGTPSVKPLCDLYKSFLHPNFPSGMPLAIPSAPQTQ